MKLEPRVQRQRLGFVEQKDLPDTPWPRNERGYRVVRDARRVVVTHGYPPDVRTKRGDEVDGAEELGSLIAVVVRGHIKVELPKFENALKILGGQKFEGGDEREGTLEVN